MKTHLATWRLMGRLIGLLAFTMALTFSTHAQTSAMTSTVSAFFYQNPVLLTREAHQHLRVKPADMRFASKSTFVPLVTAEFAEACLEYPIAFFKGEDGQWLALALTGLHKDTNAFIDAQGQWQARYVPASVRRYPFILAESQDKQLSLALDLAAPHVVHAGKEGEAIFDASGQPSDFINKLMPVLAEYQGQAKQTHAFIQQLSDAGLLVQSKLQVRQSEDRNAEVDGMWIVDEAKLRGLADDKALAWFKNGELAVIHAHMLSLRNLVALFARSYPASLASTAKPAPAPAVVAAPAQPPVNSKK